MSRAVDDNLDDVANVRWPRVMVEGKRRPTCAPRCDDGAAGVSVIIDHRHRPVYGHVNDCIYGLILICKPILGEYFAFISDG